MKVITQASSHVREGQSISIYLTKMEVCKLIESMAKEDFGVAVVDKSEDGKRVFTVSISKFN